ncbi:MAG: class I SAM-dependent methyltransferase [Clostridia bacterium]|nr:class I SAM-dependent methyltransferase [Clostridia bacterium]
MRTPLSWEDYELIDCSEGERLERWKDIILIRPDPQVIWKTRKKHPLWKKANARYVRSNSGGGKWETFTRIPAEWNVDYNDLTFHIKTMGFKHTGLFPEQAVNWDYMTDLIKNAGRPVKVLNLFAYTGGATIACLKAGAHVTHVDASKGMVQWARENAELSGVSDKPVRWLVDDCIKFVQREIRRGNKYDIIIMDPPSYGRGPGGEIWKLEDEVYNFVSLCSEIVSDDAIAMFINSYTTGLAPSVMQYILGSIMVPKFGGNVSSDEIGIPVTSSKMVLPCGATAIWQK